MATSRSITDTATPYYERAFSVDMDALWGAIPQWKTHIPDLCYARALTAFYNGKPDDYEDRFALLRKYMEGVLSEETLTRYRNAFPRSTIVPRIAKLTNTLYLTPPARTFTGDDATDSVWNEEYKRAGYDRQLVQVQRLGWLSNVVAVRPEIDARGRLVLRRLPRDMFRMVTNEDDETDIVQFWVPSRRYEADGKMRTTFKVWEVVDQNEDGSPVVMRSERDYKGNVLENTEPEIEALGRIPWIVYRRVDDETADPYGEGRLDLVEASMWNWTLDLSGKRSALYDGLRVKIGINLGVKGANIRLAPDELITVEDVTEQEGANIPPEFRTLDGDNAYTLIDEFRRERQKEVLRNEGLPDYMVESGTTPPSGVALQIMERELRRNQLEDTGALSAFERDLAEMTALVVNQSRGRTVLDPAALEAFSIRFQEGEVTMEPADQLTYDLDRYAAGLMDASTLVRRYLGQELSEQESVARIAEIKGLASGGTQPEPTPPDNGAQ